MPAPLQSLKSVLPTHTHAAGEVCPWCEQPIPADQSEKILSHIKERETQQQEEQALRLRQEFGRREAEAQKRFEADKVTAVAKAHEDAVKENAEVIQRLRKAAVERLADAEKTHEDTVKQVKADAAEREALVRADATQAAIAKSFQQIEAANQAAAEAKSAASDAATKLKALEEAKEIEIAARLAEARDAYEKDLERVRKSICSTS